MQRASLDAIGKSRALFSWRPGRPDMRKARCSEGLRSISNGFGEIHQIRKRNVHEQTQNFRIKLSSAVCKQPANRLFSVDTFSIATIRDHRVERVDHGDDSRTERYFRMIQTGRVALSINTFMMMQYE
jgi:hypothetical protein